MAERGILAESKKTSSLIVTLMFLIMSFSSIIGNVSAVGTNQNDIGTSGGDLPDNLSSPTSIPNLIFSNSITGSGELASGTDELDYLRVNLASNEGLAVELSFDQADDFDLAILDSTQTAIDSSYLFNPETVSTNVSSVTGIVYIQISAYTFGSMSNGSYDITIWKFTTSSTGGGNGSGGSSGISVPSPCTGNGTTAPDILEPNDTPATATLASLLPVDCTGLSVEINSAGVANDDYFEVQMISGVTYYFNLTFTHTNGDIDATLEDASGLSLSFNNFGFMTSSSDDEAADYTATSNFTAYFKVYHYSSFGSTGTVANVYDIEISTDNPGGGQSFSTIDVTMNNLTNITIEMTGLTAGDTYEYEFYQSFENGANESITYQTAQGPYSFVATSTTEIVNYTISGGDIEGYYSVTANLSDNLGAKLSSDEDSIYKEILVTQTTSSTTGEILASNLTIGNQYTLRWVVFDEVIFDDELDNGETIDDALNTSLVDENYSNITSTATNNSWQISWMNPTTANQHVLLALLSVQGSVTDLFSFEGYEGSSFSDFIPQLPSAVITNYSFSTTSVTNEYSSEGLDLVVGDSYYQQYRVEDSGGADIDYSTMTSYTATSQNMSFGTFFYNTPSISGQYCIFSELYDSNMIQLIGDYVCLQFVFDDDNDGVANEDDICPNTNPGSMVDADGCELSQKDTDGDGYNDDVDDYPNDATQWVDGDGDGYGDNPNGNVPDAFPYDSTQWADQDGDGYGDNPNGNYSDMFPTDPTQWSDTDGDGYGDNANGNNADLWPTDSTQWTDSDGDGYGDNPSGTSGDQFPFDATQWADQDGDGFGDNPSGNDADQFPTDGTQWEDQDGDGYGDNVNGNNADKFPTEPTQWYDSDNDGYGDNQAGLSPDAFPNDGTQWVDQDGDGYGDNQNGNNPDKFITEPTQWFDADGDGFGDNANGNNPDLCPNTPFGDSVDSTGCSASQLDDDMDGVYNDLDACPLTPAGEIVDSSGCSGSQKDSDNDGVMDLYDSCPFTPLNAIIDNAGCADSQLDTDNDGISDDIDLCPSTDPQVNVNGQGCSASQRDTDLDGVKDNVDLCSSTPIDESPDNEGCSNSQKDDDFDGVYNDQDNCPDTALNAVQDSFGCSEDQYDDDNDLIDNTLDQCPATPSGEQVDSSGCSESQKDEDNDDIWNSDDLCYDTVEGQSVDQQGCSESQKDDDDDGLSNANDECKNTPASAIVNSKGCAKSQIDTDGDGVNDAEDAFPSDGNESVDTDGDGISDRWDDYPEDPTRSESVSEDSGNGMMYTFLAIVVLGIIGALLVVRSRQTESQQTSLFTQQMQYDNSTEANMQPQKEIPNIENQNEATSWEENGVHWNRDAEGNLSYFNQQSQAWETYNLQ
jgi:hypothetical protein